MTDAEKVIELQDELIDVLRERNALQARLAEVISNSARDHNRWATERLNREVRIAEAHTENAALLDAVIALERNVGVLTAQREKPE